MGTSNALKRKQRAGLCCLQPCSHVDRQGGFSRRLNSCHVPLPEMPMEALGSLWGWHPLQQALGHRRCGHCLTSHLHQDSFPWKTFSRWKKMLFLDFLGTKNYQSFEVLFLAHANNLVTRRPQWQHSHFLFFDCWCPCNVISVSSWNKKPKWKVITSIHILTLPWEGCAHGSSMLSQKTKCFQGMKENCWGLHCVLILPTGRWFPRGLQEGIQKMYTWQLFSLPTPDFNFIIFKPYAFH